MALHLRSTFSSHLKANKKLNTKINFGVYINLHFWAVFNHRSSKMRHFLVKSVVARALITGGSRNFNRQLLTAVTAPEMKLRHAGAYNNSGYWLRMSTLAPSSAEKEQKEENSISEEKKRENGNAVVPSYWGITRPKHKREDGTEWPWNCFMVRIWIVLTL